MSKGKTTTKKSSPPVRASRKSKRVQSKPSPDADIVSSSSTTITPPSTPQPKAKKSRSSSSSSSSSKRQRIEPGSLPPPPNWESIYTLVEELRKDRTAPVDHAGCEALVERHRGEVIQRFQVLIALMLSSQTKDGVVGETMRALQQHGLDVETIHKTEHDTLNSLIRKVGFHNNKTKYIKQTASILLEEYGGDIPTTAEDMMKLPGVGPKMSYILESVAFGKTSGIGVDTHMHRMFNDLKWVNSTTPEKTREQLEGWLPKDKWDEINVLFVGFGQEVQQQKEKTLVKVLGCSRPMDALGLCKKLGLDYKKEGKKFGLKERIDAVFSQVKK